METDIFDVAFSAVYSLRCRIVYLFDPPWDDMAVRETLAIAFFKSGSFEELAERVRQMRESRLVADIMDAASGLSKALDSHFIVPQCECHRGGMAIFDIINLKLEIYSFNRRVDAMEAKMKEYAASTRIGSNGKKSKTVGFSDLYIELRDKVILYWPRSVQFLSIYGMGGAGKTTLAKELFVDRLSSNHFDCRAWVTVGRNPQLKEIARSILTQVGDENTADLSFEKRKKKKKERKRKRKRKKKDENIADQYLKDSLRGRRYLIVLDDVWDEWIQTKVAPLLPDDQNSSVVLLTTRLGAVASYSGRIKMRLLNKEESWNLLREKVFGEELCPYQLEKAGKKIAERCDGLPLTIVTVANLLSKVEKTLQYWNELAAKKNHRLFTAAYNDISKVLLPSYKHLPQILQMCFLYMGVFPQNYEIPRSKLINMWCTDGFLDKISNDDAMNCLDKLISNSVVMIYQSTVKHGSLDLYEEQVKTCGLHSSFWHLSNREAGKTKFCCVLNSLSDGLGKSRKRQHRLSFHNNILFGIKDVYRSVEDNCASIAHSLLFYGPYHQYQVPVCFGLKLLKQLDALTIRFYEFPVEILQLVQLRYLALTMNEELPTSISQLSNLEVLIVGQHMSIKSYRAPSYLPVELWSMNKLQHLQVMGCDLPDPPCGTSLESLSTLSNVSALSCTKDILKAVPNLQKLGIRIELAPHDVGVLVCCFDNIFHLERLKSLKCVAENLEVVQPPAPLSIFSPCLEKLSLSGLGYSWEEMSKLSSLPCLRVLKLRNYAFRGPKWEVEESGFSSLYSLAIEDTDLEEWKIGAQSFPLLYNLSMKHCYKLKKIHGEFRMFLNKIEFVDCNPLGVKQMEKIRWTAVDVSSSWNHGN